MTWSLRAFGHAPRTSTAPADATAAANDVPCGRRYSCGPQSEYPWSAQSGRRAVIARGSVEKSSSPGAARSL